MSEVERSLGRRFFRKLTDAELIAWRPTQMRGWFGWTDSYGNVGAANREMRRRAKLEGLASPYDWLAKHDLRYQRRSA